MSNSFWSYGPYTLPTAPLYQLFLRGKHGLADFFCHCLQNSTSGELTGTGFLPFHSIYSFNAVMEQNVMTSTRQNHPLASFLSP